MTVSVTIDDAILQKANHCAELAGTTVDVLMREYLVQLAGGAEMRRDAEEFRRLSKLTHGNSNGWKFDRDEAHDHK